MSSPDCSSVTDRLLTRRRNPALVSAIDNLFADGFEHDHVGGVPAAGAALCQQQDAHLVLPVAERQRQQ